MWETTQISKNHGRHALETGKTRLGKRPGLMADENDPFCTVLLLPGQVSEAIRVPKGEVAGRIGGLTYVPEPGRFQTQQRFARSPRLRQK